MERDLILGTAGHIDHGKTALVKALTGIDCDRLPDEKRRGITIDIGFAHLELPGVRLGIVDCPGHERFIKNMLAGSTGIDLALLVVAADDSVMPQTREHLEILQLLGLRQGVIALTKCDSVDEAKRELVEYEVRDLVQGTFLADAPVVHTSAHTGMGLDRLREALDAAAHAVKRLQEREWFRLGIDRSFVVQGHGTVVTGSVVSGSLKVGDEIEWLPRGEKVRVRSLQNHDRPVEEVRRGQRAAINLAGVPHEEVHRGQELAAPGYLKPSRVLTVRLHALNHLPRPLKHRTPLRVYLGTAEVIATLSLLDSNHLDPGQWGLAQLFLEDAVVAVWGQPLVVRDSSAEHTLGGGQVLQPVARKIRRRHLESLDRIEKLGSEDEETRGLVVAWLSEFRGLGVAEFVREAGIAPGRAAAVLKDLLASGQLVEMATPSGKTVVHPERLQQLEERVLQTLGEFHAAQPLLTNHDRQQVLAALKYLDNEPLRQSVVDHLIREKKLVGDAKRIARADFKPKLSANQRKLKDRIVEAHLSGGFNPPEPKSFAPHAGGNTSNLSDIFEVAVAEGLLAKVTDEIFLHHEYEVQLRERVVEKLKSVPGLSVADIRDLLGTTRKYAVPFCEYLDRVGVTRREGDLRVSRS
jgi:selenocysteine-specific elongation factor